MQNHFNYESPGNYLYCAMYIFDFLYIFDSNPIEEILF